MPKLTERDAEILTFARDWYAFRGAHEAAVRERFDMTATRYFLELNRIIDLPAAMAYDPFTTRRLQRIRTERQRSRSLRHA